MEPGGEAPRGRHPPEAEVLLAVCLLPFLFAGGWLGWLIFVNGVAYHLAAAWGSGIEPALRAWDTGCNVAGVLLVNALTPWQPLTALVSVLGCVCWQANNALLAESTLVHALGVQWPAAAMLFLANRVDPY